MKDHVKILILLAILVMSFFWASATNSKTHTDALLKNTASTSPTRLPEAGLSQATHITNKNEIEVVKLSPVIVLRGEVNGNQANVLFDTGSWPNFISRKPKSEVPAPIESNRKTEIKSEYCSSENLKVGKFAFASPDNVQLVDLEKMKQAVGIEIDAIAGIPFAKSGIIEIDFQDKKFYVDRRSVRDYEISRDIEFDGYGRPWIEVQIGGIKGLFLVDTGFNGFFSINQESAEILQQNGIAEHGEYSIAGQLYSQDDGLQAYEHDTLEIEHQLLFGKKFENVIASVSKEPEESNKIGLGFLRCFNIAIDLEHRKLMLTPIKN